jgi:hypothetical protein
MSTTSENSAERDLLGAQLPRISSCPTYVSSSGDDAIGLAALAGLDLDPWQQLVLRESLGETAEGKWSAFEVGLVVARQNGKDSILEARELTEMFLVADEVGPRLILHSAHRADTASEHFLRLAARIVDCPELAKRVKHRGARMVGIRTGNGKEQIELQDGTRILFASRTASGRRGFTGDLLIWNEAMELSDAAVGSVMPTISAKTMGRFPGVQIWYAGSAVNQETMADGVQLSRVRTRGLKGSPTLAYFEWSAEDDDDLDDPNSWVKGNPGLGIRIDPAHIHAEREAMPRDQFAVERGGIGNWFDVTADAGRVISKSVWASCAEHDATQHIVSDLFFAIDCDPDQTWGSIAVGGKRADGRIQVAVVEHRPRVDWLVDAVLALRAEHPRARFVVDRGGPASDQIDLLEIQRVRGKRLVEADTTFYRNACIGFVTAAHADQLRYPAPQPELDDALAGAVKARMVDSWKWSRAKSTSVEISPLIAVTMAYWATASLMKARSRVVNPYEVLANA